MNIIRSIFNGGSKSVKIKPKTVQLKSKLNEQEKSPGRVRVFLKTLGRDLHGISCLVGAALKLREFEKVNVGVGDVFLRTVEKYPEKICFRYQTNKWTFKEVWETSNQIGNYFIGQGYKKGDVVALFMTNRPEYVVIWLGLSKVGLITALVNSSQRHEQLRHSLNIVGSKAIIYGTELSTALEDAYKIELSQGKICPLFSYPESRLEAQAPHENSKLLKTHSQNLFELIKNVGNSNPPSEVKPKFFDTLFYIYTSGTTGLPKAVIFKHCRLLSGAVMSHQITSAKPSDILYTCLPLYHTAANLIGVGQTLVYGNTCIVAPKFSASNFWIDCSDHQVTIAQYIGEICRHLLSQPTSINENIHSIHTIVGNGLSSNIWQDFVSRFKIKNVTEVYGASEGNCTMFNADGRVGAIGFAPTFLRRIFPIKVMRTDEQTGEPIRNTETGLVLQCKPNQVGEMMGKIDRKNPIREFPGYTADPQGTKKKTLRNVFSKNDEAFRTGDDCMMDDFGYFYFVDRTGDTFRWKGENVSTTQVESILSNCCNYKDLVVYGVQVVGQDGRIGMVTIADPHRVVDLNFLAKEMEKSLPSYARPFFVRISKEIEMTGTHKLKKVKLQNEGFDPKNIDDPIYFFKDGKYLPLDFKTYLEINGGHFKF